NERSGLALCWRHAHHQAVQRIEHTDLAGQSRALWLGADSELQHRRLQIVRRREPLSPGRIHMHVARSTDTRPPAIRIDPGYAVCDSHLHQRLTGFCCDGVRGSAMFNESDPGHARSTSNVISVLLCSCEPVPRSRVSKAASESSMDT